MNAKLKIVTINPSEAEKLLENIFEGQRPVTSSHVIRLANEIKAGEFRLSPDCILLVKGKLANGQHRLRAVVQARKSASFILMESDDEDLYKVIDSGNKRSVADVIQGEYANVVATAARWIVLYDLESISVGGAGKNEEKCTRSLCVEFAQQSYEALLGCVHTCNKLYSEFKVVPPSMSAAALFIGRRDSKAPDRVCQFIQNIYDGESTGDASRDFRERILRSRMGSAKLGRFHVMALLMKSMKSYINGTRMGVVRINEGESFPRIK